MKYNRSMLAENKGLTIVWKTTPFYKRTPGVKVSRERSVYAKSLHYQMFKSWGKVGNF